MHVYEVRPRKDHRGVDLISDALPFGATAGGIITRPNRRVIGNPVRPNEIFAPKKVSSTTHEQISPEEQEAQPLTSCCDSRLR